MYYEESCGRMYHAIHGKFPGIEAKQCDEVVPKEHLPAHLLWMIGMVEGWDTSDPEKAVKAARWIGWMFRAMEELELFTADDCRELPRQDVASGNHLPHVVIG